MFQLKNFTTVKVLSVNVRSENHGSDHVPALDLKLQMEVPNTMLDLLDVHLLSMLYKPLDAKGSDGQETLEGVEAVSHMPLLRTTTIKWPLVLGLEFAGYQLDIDRGLGGKSNIALLETNVNKFQITGKEGGTVSIVFRVQASKVSDDVIGKLAGLLKSETKIALKAPEVKQAPIDGSTAAFEKDKADKNAGKKPAPAAKTTPAPKHARHAKPPAAAPGQAATDEFLKSQGQKPIH